MKITSQVVSLIALLTMSATVSQVHADSDISIVPYAEAGYSHYTVEFSGLIPTGEGPEDFIRGDNTFVYDAPVVKLGLAAMFGKFSANIFWKGSGEGNDVQTFEDDDGNPLPVPPVNWTADREETSLSAGYSFTDAITVFAGYRDVEIRGEGSFRSTYEYTHDGFTLGGSYRWGVSSSGGLTLSLGYAWLDVDIEETLGGIRLPDGTGDGDGLKAGLVWRDFLTERLGYSVAAEYYEFDFTLDEFRLNTDDGVVVLDGNTDVKETDTLFSVGLFYIF